MYAVSGPTAIGTTGQINTLYGNTNCGGILDVTNSTASTSTTTGALVVAGGVGIGGSIYIGGTINVTGAVTFLDSQFTIENVTTPSKELNFALAGQTGSTELTIASLTTATLTLSIPALTTNDTIVTAAFAQTLTNKNITDSGSSVYATGLWYGSHAGPVTFATSGAPSNGYVLTATSGTTATWQVPSITDVYDGTFVIENTSDHTKQLNFSLGGQTISTEITIASLSTATLTLSIPALTTNDTFVTAAFAQTLTNKNITDSGSSVYATGLWYGSYTGTVTFATASAPSSGQALVATSSSTATWQSSSAYITNVLDGSFVIENTSDTSKKLNFSLGSQTTGTEITISSLSTATLDLFIPALTTNDTIVTAAFAQTLTNKNITDSGSSVYATGIWYGSHVGTVTFATASAPSSGQVLTATSSSSATWQTPTVPTESSLAIPPPYTYQLSYVATAGPADYQGGIHYLTKPTTASNAYIYVNTNVASSNISVGFYQYSDGSANVGSAWNLITYANISGTTAGIATAALHSGPITFQPGVIAVIWATSSVSLQIANYSTSQYSTYYFYSVNTITGKLVWEWTSSSAYSGTSPPATLTPTTSGVTISNSCGLLAFALD